MPLIQNAVRLTAENRFLVSTHRDIPVTHTFPDGKTLSIAGGLEWTQRDGDLYELDDARAYEEWNLMDDWDFQLDIAPRLLYQAGDAWRLVKDAPAEEMEALARGEGWVARVAQYWLIQ